MSSHGLRKVFDELKAANNNLVTAKASDVDKFKMEFLGTDKVKGVWNEKDGTTVIIPLIGVVDLSRSFLGAYGNCYFDKQERAVPTKEDLLKSKFNVALSHLMLPEGHVDADLDGCVSNQMYMLANIEDNAINAMKIRRECAENPNTTDWARFEETDYDGTQSWAHITLGPCFKSTVRKVKASDVKDASPRKLADKNAVRKPDIEDDPKDFVKNLEKPNLRHNEELPCFKTNGDRIGRTSKELRQEIYQGRWIRVDVELIMWRMKGKLIFTLHAAKLVVLDCPPADGVNGMAYEPMQKSITAAEGEDDDTVSEGASEEARGIKRKAETGPSEPRLKPKH